VGLAVKLPRLLPLELWFALNHALPRHPLLRHQFIPKRRTFSQHLRGLFLNTGALALISVGLLAWALLRLPLELLVLASSLIAGGQLARAIAARIHVESRHGWLDLLAVTPSGLHGACWAISTRYLRTDEDFHVLHMGFTGFHALWGLLLIPLWIASLISSLNPFLLRYAATEQAYILTVNLTLWLVLLRLDYLYTLTTAALIGMLVPAAARSRIESASAAVVLLLLTQFLVYAGVLLIGQTVLALAATTFGVVTWPVMSLIWLAVFVIVRESALYGVCFTVAQRFSISVRELISIHRSSL
jgi:hypothetical protein